jgi:hypothetical protein
LIEKEYEKHQKLNEEQESNDEKEEYKEHHQKHINLEITRIERSPLPHEGISRDIDFSPERIEALVDQGYKDTKETVSKELSSKALAPS